MLTKVLAARVSLIVISMLLVVQLIRSNATPILTLALALALTLTLTLTLTPALALNLTLSLGPNLDPNP